MRDTAVMALTLQVQAEARLHYQSQMRQMESCSASDGERIMIESVLSADPRWPAPVFLIPNHRSRTRNYDSTHSHPTVHGALCGTDVPRPGSAGGAFLKRVSTWAYLLFRVSAAATGCTCRLSTPNHATRPSAPKLGHGGRSGMDVCGRHGIRPLQGRHQPQEQEARRSATWRPARRE